MNAILEDEPAISAATRELSAVGKATRTVETQQIFGRHVRLDIIEPGGAGPKRTILLLHGVGGLLGDGGLLRRAARSLAEHHFRTGVVHYFNATGTFLATPSNVREHAGTWQIALREIADNYAQTTGGPIGLMGYSLGGFLAAGAAQHTPAIGAVAVLSGGLLEGHEDSTPAHLPPLLVLHGGKDARVPVERADALVGMGRRFGTLVESIVYPNEGHSFGASAERDAFQRMAQFFTVRLGTGARR